MTRRAVLAACLLVMALTAAACSSDDPDLDEATPGADAASTSTGAGEPAVASAGCEAGAAEVEAGTTDHTFESADGPRSYELLVPDDYDGTTPLPLVLGLHSLTVSYQFVSTGAGFADMFAEHDFIAVMPSGRTDPTSFWLATPTEENYDLTYLDDLLDQLETDLCIDTSRVFSTGLSNGGQMSSLLACQMSDRITAVAPIAGAEFPAERCQGAPVPVMAFHGDADEIVPYDGGGLDAATIANQNLWQGNVPPDVPQHEGVDSAMTNWAEHNGCAPEPTEERVSPEVIRRTWSGCEADTVLYIVEGGGHSWPGHPVPGFEAQFGHTTTDIDATALMFDFFFAQ